MPNKLGQKYYYWRNLDGVHESPFFPELKYGERNCFEGEKGVLMSHAVELINKWNEEFNPSGYYYSLEEYYAE